MHDKSYIVLCMLLGAGTIAKAAVAGGTTTSSTAKATSTPECQAYVDTFDNYTTLPGGSEATPITFLGNLQYIDFDANNGNPTGLAGITPASSPIIAGASINQDLTDSGSVTLNAFGTLSTTGTATKSFELVEFYFACGNSVNGIITPVGCAIEVSGFDIYGNQVGSVAFNYAPKNATSSGMSRAILPIYYLLLRNVTWGIATPSAQITPLVYLMDNVTHKNCD